MCRFKLLKQIADVFAVEFQYILCVGSREVQLVGTDEFIVSIHPMCRFKGFYYHTH